MSRYKPSADEIAALTASGNWRIDDEGWWWHVPPRNEYGRTFREAQKEESRNDADHD